MDGLTGTHESWAVREEVSRVAVKDLWRPYLLRFRHFHVGMGALVETARSLYRDTEWRQWARLLGGSTDVAS